MSVFSGKRVSANAFALFSTAELQRDLQSASLDAVARAKIEAEIERRAKAAKAKAVKAYIAKLKRQDARDGIE